MHFDVRTEALRDMVNTLRSIDGQLADLGLLPGGFEGVVGDHRVEHALTQFVNDWVQGVGNVRVLADRLQTLVAAAADGYDSADGAVVTAAGE